MDPKMLNRLLVSLLIAPVVLIAVFWIIGFVQRIILLSIVSATGVFINTWWFHPVRYTFTALAGLWIVFLAVLFIKTGEFRLPRTDEKK